GTPVEDEFYRVQTNERGMFRIPDVPPGEYSLTNRVAGPPIWRLKVTLKAGEDLQFDLTPENSVKVRDDFPESR
ncbi:MAG: carboxypeptidase-like regulatory domain-containing protein, partial [bacterium]